MDDSVSRFWDKYIDKTVVCDVQERARRWYVRHVEEFIKAFPGSRLSAIVANDVVMYLEGIGRANVTIKIAANESFNGFN